tara:strand:- start:844 stop:1269 length:426 start_codon:yes stop_codon:yes gene_type:complete
VKLENNRIMTLENEAQKQEIEHLFEKMFSETPYCDDHLDQNMVTGIEKYKEAVMEFLRHLKNWCVDQQQYAIQYKEWENDGAWHHPSYSECTQYLDKKLENTDLVNTRMYCRLLKKYILGRIVKQILDDLEKSGIPLLYHN